MSKIRRDRKRRQKILKKNITKRRDFRIMDENERRLDKLEKRINVKRKKYNLVTIIGGKQTKNQKELADWFKKYRMSKVCREENPDIFVNTFCDPGNIPHMFYVNDKGVDEITWKEIRKYRRDFLIRHKE